MRLDGKAVLISSGARGQGAEEARLFALEGARVLIGDLLEEDGKRVAADVTQEADWRLVVEEAV